MVPEASVYIGIVVDEAAPFLDVRSRALTFSPAHLPLPIPPLMLKMVANPTMDKSKASIGIIIRDGPSAQRYKAIVEAFLANGTVSS